MGTDGSVRRRTHKIIKPWKSLWLQVHERRESERKKTWHSLESACNTAGKQEGLIKKAQNIAKNA